MSSASVLPFEHPTTVALVDDDPAFLHSFALSQTREGPVNGFGEPRALLSALNAQGPISAALHHPERVPDLAEPTRFDLYSVLVTDYEMGPVNGIELCRRLPNRAVGRILLTGKVDEHFAVQAFNEDVIDRYLRKDDPRLVELTRRYTAELKREFFRRSITPHQDPRYGSQAAFLFDTGFAAFFADCTRESAVVEHHLCFDIPGFLMLDADGELLLLIVMGEGRLAEHVETAENRNAPRELVELMRSGMVLPCFPDRGGFYSPAYADSWKNWTVTARIVEGRKRFYTATVSGPAAQAALGNAKVLSYNHHLNTREGATPDTAL